MPFARLPDRGQSANRHGDESNPRKKLADRSASPRCWERNAEWPRRFPHPGLSDVPLLKLLSILSQRCATWTLWSGHAWRTS